MQRFSSRHLPSETFCGHTALKKLVARKTNPVEKTVITFKAKLEENNRRVVSRCSSGEFLRCMFSRDEGEQLQPCNTDPQHSHKNSQWRYEEGFEVLITVVMKSSVVWNITLCSPLKVSRCFGGTWRIHLQGRRIGKARNQHEAGSKESPLLATCFMLVSCLTDSLMLKMEATCYSETSVDFQLSIKHYIPEDTEKILLKTGRGLQQSDLRICHANSCWSHEELPVINCGQRGRTWESLV
jgi:hypothetical protein